MWLMLQQDKPEDFVIATGITTSVRDFLRKTFTELGVELEFTGSGKEEKATVKQLLQANEYLKVGQVVVKVDPRYFRPTEVDLLIGDPAKAKAKLNWQPKYSLDSLIKEMVAADLELFKRDRYLKDGGHKVFEYHE